MPLPVGLPRQIPSGVTPPMPVMDDLRALLRGGHLSAGRTIILHPADFTELTLACESRGMDPASPLDNNTIFGVRIVSSPSHPQGRVSVVADPPGCSLFPQGTERPNANGDVFPSLLRANAEYLRDLEERAFNVASSAFLGGRRSAPGFGGSEMGQGGDGADGCIVIEEWGEVPLKSLWQHLEEDE
jgi:hypothetical protein